MIQASGCKFIRENLYSQVIETTLGQYDFSWYDQISAACSARGIRIIYDYNYGSPAFGATDMSSAAWRQDYTDFVTATATHFKGQGNIYELWNEPYIQTDSSQIVDNYMAFVKQVSPAIRRRTPVRPSLLSP